MAAAVPPNERELAGSTFSAAHAYYALTGASGYSFPLVWRDTADFQSTLQVSGAVNIGGALSVQAAANIVGNFSVNTSKFTVNATTGNTAILGDLAVNSNKFTVGSTTGNTAILGDFAVNTNKFTVAAASGNTVVAGTLDVTGNLTVNTNKFSANATSGDVAVGGELEVTGNFACNGLSAVAPQSYTLSNVTTRRTMDADTITLPQLADLVGTYLGDMNDVGLVEA